MSSTSLPKPHIATRLLFHVVFVSIIGVRSFLETHTHALAELLAQAGSHANRGVASSVGVAVVQGWFLSDRRFGFYLRSLVG